MMGGRSPKWKLTKIMNIEIFYEEEQSLYEEEERGEEDVEVEQNLESQLSVHGEL